MNKVVEIEYLDLEKNKEYEEVIKKVLEKCFYVEKMQNFKVYISITLTNPENIRNLNKKYRNIDKETDVLSFPMFEKSEIPNLKNLEFEETLGDIVISIERVRQQAIEYGHSFERELAYMVVHGFYHLMGEDHIEEQDKIIMREKEDKVLNELKIFR
ncbi:MAG TPA: rRNA maturation RNase YbeY [Candidatus Scatovivens faecipullorum]|nr:rRNA maturation RNase YbeY [Candidatus Scatovivens faecipullorum]